MSDNEGSGDDLIRIRDNIIDFVEAALANNRPCYLSALGIRLGADVRELRRVAQVGLADFIQEKLGDRYQLVHADSSRSTILVERKPSVVEGAVLPLLESSAPVKTKYVRELWTAFAVPWNGEGRYFNLKRRIWRNRPEEDESDSWLSIESQYVRPQNGLYNEDEISEKLRRWCSDNNLNVEDYVIKGHPIKSTGRPSIKDQTALDWLISGLDRRRLESIQLPLDVINILSSKTVSRG